MDMPTRIRMLGKWACMSCCSSPLFWVCICLPTVQSLANSYPKHFVCQLQEGWGGGRRGGKAMLYIEFVLGSRTAESISPFVAATLFLPLTSSGISKSRTHREWEWEKRTLFPARNAARLLPAVDYRNQLKLKWLEDERGRAVEIEKQNAAFHRLCYRTAVAYSRDCCSVAYLRWLECTGGHCLPGSVGGLSSQLRLTAVPIESTGEP